MSIMQQWHGTGPLTHKKGLAAKSRATFRAAWLKCTALTFIHIEIYCPASLFWCSCKIYFFFKWCLHYVNYFLLGYILQLSFSYKNLEFIKSGPQTFCSKLIWLHPNQTARTLCPTIVKCILKPEVLVYSLTLSCPYFYFGRIGILQSTMLFHSI